MATEEVVVAVETKDAAQRRKELAFYAWLAGTVVFTGVDWRSDVTFSMATRRFMYLHTPVGRVVLAGGMAYLYIHLVKPKERRIHASVNPATGQDSSNGSRSSASSG